MNWVPFDQYLWSNQPLPPERRKVLLMLPAKEDWCSLPPAVAVGYLRFAAGDKDSPRFTIPGVGGTPTHWCDCLGDDFEAPLWSFARKQKDLK